MNIEDQIDDYRKKLASAETTIAIYIEKMEEYKSKLKKAGIATTNLGTELRKMKRNIERLQKQERDQLQKVGEIITEIEKGLE